MMPGADRPELHRPVPLERIGAAGLTVTVEATAAECAAIASRLKVPAVRWLRCRFGLSRGDTGLIEATGRLEAVVERTCVLSLDEFDSPVTEAFAVRFVPSAAGPQEDEIDPAEIDAPDEIVYDGTSLDLGEAAVEQLALALDPYPRKPGALLPMEEEPAEPGPFAALSRWSRTQ